MLLSDCCNAKLIKKMYCRICSKCRTICIYDALYKGDEPVGTVHEAKHPRNVVELLRAQRVIGDDEAEEMMRAV